MPGEFFETRERALLGPRYDALYADFDAAAARGVTVSALRCTPQQFAAKADFALEPSRFCAAGFAVRDAAFRPGRHPYHHAGVFYSQEPSASSAAPLLGVRPGMRVLDMCAAPGGKSSQLAAALRGRGVLVSNEYVAARAEILRSNLERMGVPNAVVLNETPARIAKALPEFFDRILVDAPCSGEGMFRKEPVALTQHSAELVAQCAALGAEILDSAAAALAPGGELVYSTCTFAPEEDEAQVGAFLARHLEFSLLPVLGELDFAFGSEGEANRVGAHPFDVSLVRRIWPCQGGEGHFMARFRKAGEARVLPGSTARFNGGNADGQPAGDADISVAGTEAGSAAKAAGLLPYDAALLTAEERSWLEAACALNTEKGGKASARPAARRTGDERCRGRFDEDAGRPRRGKGSGRDAAPAGGKGIAGKAAAAQGAKAVLEAWQAFVHESFPALAARPAAVVGDCVYLPVAMPSLRLHILRNGVFAGRVVNGRFVPEHHLFTAFGALCANCEELTLADVRTAAYLLGGEIEAGTAAPGWCCVTVDGWPLGGGKVSGGRVKNHYPKALRNLMARQTNNAHP